MAKYKSDSPIDDTAVYGIRILSETEGAAIIELSGLELKTLLRLLTLIA